MKSGPKTQPQNAAIIALLAALDANERIVRDFAHAPAAAKRAVRSRAEIKAALKKLSVKDEHGIMTRVVRAAE